MHSDKTNKSHLIGRTETFRRVRVFAVTSGALFLLLSLIWPISGTTFRTLVNIDIDVAGQERDSKQWNTWLTQHVRAELSDASLEALTNEVQSLAPLRSTAIASSDFAAIRQSVSYGVKPKSDRLTIQVAFDGLGTDDEPQFIRGLATRIANRVANDSDHDNTGHLELVDQFQQLKSAIGQIENELQSPTFEFADQTNPSMPTLSGHTGDSHGQFQYASASTATPSLSGPGESDEPADMKRVAMALNRMESLLHQHSGASRETGSVSDSVLALASRTRPIDGVPGKLGLLLISLVSIMVGSVIAIQYNPFVNAGFKKIETVAQTLGVPVIATISRRDQPSGATPVEPASNGSDHWANQCATIATRVLLGLSVVVLGFVLLNGDVRQAFFENPSYGFVQIVRVFLGY